MFPLREIKRPLNNNKFNNSKSIQKINQLKKIGHSAKSAKFSQESHCQTSLVKIMHSLLVESIDIQILKEILPT